MVDLVDGGGRFGVASGLDGAGHGEAVIFHIGAGTGSQWRDVGATEVCCQLRTGSQSARKVSKDR